jgi:hypothetical protein
MNLRQSVADRILIGSVLCGLAMGVLSAMQVAGSNACVANQAATNGGDPLGCEIGSITFSIPVMSIEAWFNTPLSPAVEVVITGVSWFVISFLIVGSVTSVIAAVNVIPPRPILTARSLIDGMVLAVLAFGFLVILWQFQISPPVFCLWLFPLAGFILGLFLDYRRSANTHR